MNEEMKAEGSNRPWDDMWFPKFVKGSVQNEPGVSFINYPDARVTITGPQRVIGVFAADSKLLGRIMELAHNVQEEIRAEIAVAAAKERNSPLAKFREKVAAIADDFEPSSPKEAAQALEEMREALHNLLTEPTTDDPDERLKES